MDVLIILLIVLVVLSVAFVAFRGRRRKGTVMASQPVENQGGTP